MPISKKKVIFAFKITYDFSIVMKHTCFSWGFLAILFCSMYGCSQPQSETLKFVGHRGSSEGVENTANAFAIGADRGYWGLECDVRVTADDRFVIMHDSHLGRFGHADIAIEQQTLDTLLSLELTQTRWDSVYTGRLCTLEEYLDLCTERNVVPVIELKETRRLNGDDWSMLPDLLEIVRSHGLLERSVFISFMYEPLRWMRTGNRLGENYDYRADYASLNIQFLCSMPREPQYFDSLVRYRLDLDIMYGLNKETQQPYFDSTLVQRYHDAGLIVNTWTIDNPDRLAELEAMHVDYVTTNKLTKANLTGQQQN